MSISRDHGEQRRQLSLRRHKLCEQIEAIEILGDGGPRLTVHLDDYASALVRRRLADEPDGTIADDVSCAALAFMLGEDDDHFAEEEIPKATARRLGTEQKEAA